MFLRWDMKHESTFKESPYTGRFFCVCIPRNTPLSDVPPIPRFFTISRQCSGCIGGHRYRIQRSGSVGIDLGRSDKLINSESLKCTMRVKDDQTREERAARAKEDREQRRLDAVKEGKEVQYLHCPLCGRNRPLNTKKGRSEFKVKLDFGVITTRIGGGNRIGFFRVDGSEVLIVDLQAEYPDVYENLREEVGKLSDALSLT